MTGPELVFVDPRVAARMDTEGGEDLIGYIRQDIYEKDVRAGRGRETIIQIMTNPTGNLVGLSSWGRVFALVSEKKSGPTAWKLISEPLPDQDLDS